MSGIEYDQTEPKRMPVMVNLLIFTVLMGIIFYATLVYYRSVNCKVKDMVMMKYQTNNMEKYNLEADKNLKSLVWIDKAQGKLQIPIGLAMDLTLQAYNKR